MTYLSPPGRTGGSLPDKSPESSGLTNGGFEAPLARSRSFRGHGLSANQSRDKPMACCKWTPVSAAACSDRRIWKSAETERFMELGDGC